MNKILYIINREVKSGPNKQLSYILQENCDKYNLHLPLFKASKNNKYTFPKSINIINFKINIYFPILSIIKLFFIIKRNNYDIIQSLVFS